MKENLKNQKGITLIALIITIIVLLILAIVSIKLVWDGGIIGHANNAVTAYNNAQINELEQLNIVEEQMKQYGGNGGNNNSEWWKLTDEEKNSINKIPEEGNIRILAQKYNGGDIEKAIYTITTSNNELVSIFIVDIADSVMVCFYTSEIEKYIEENGGGELSEIKEIYKWYTYGGSGYEQIDRYTGKSPVSISDFTNIENGCEDLVQRIINSFN